jgi:hypothetical protein
MIKQMLFAAAAALLACAAQPDVRAQMPDRIDWRIEPSSRAAQVQFGLSYRTRGGHSNWSNTTPVSDLQGLTAAQLETRDNVPVAFRIVREAGRLDCRGQIRASRGTGQCRFAPDAAFAAELARRGVGTPSPHQQLQLTLARTSLTLLDALDRGRYQQATVDDLVNAGIHGADAAYVDAIGDAGYNPRTVDGLVNMRIHGVSVGFVREMRALGYGSLRSEELVALRIHGLTPNYVRELRALGYDRLSADQLQNMRIHGVSPGFVRSTLARGGPRPDADELVAMRIHGR